jgi:hypothetical protein
VRKLLLELNNGFWNDVFANELPKYKERLDVICCHPSFEIDNVNTSFGHVINPLQNYSRTINYVGDLNCVPILAPQEGTEKAKLIIVDPHTSQCIWVTSYVNSCDLRYSFTLD